MRKTKQAAIPVPAPRKVTKAERIGYFEESLDRQIKRGREAVAALIERLGAEQPLNALEWSADAFKHAAGLKVASDVKAVIKEGRDKNDGVYVHRSDEEILREVRRIFYNEMIRKARWPARSTSVQSNVCEQEYLAAVTEMVVELDELLARLAEAEEV